jgi:hypothetical protein
MFELTDTDEITDVVKIQMSTLSSLITDDGYEAAITLALMELGWEVPITDAAKQIWVLQRSKRHCLDLLRTVAANKFKYKQANLQHRFDHFQILIQSMDKEFEAALVSEAYLFSGVDVWKMFGTHVDAGFAYDMLGKDITYCEENLVDFGPLESE